MTPAEVDERFARCLRLIKGTEDATPQEIAERPVLVAREYARAEARRCPHPQMELPVAA